MIWTFPPKWLRKEPCDIPNAAISLTEELSDIRNLHLMAAHGARNRCVSGAIAEDKFDVNLGI